jgi:hypothetical protein
MKAFLLLALISGAAQAGINCRATCLVTKKIIGSKNSEVLFFSTLPYRTGENKADVAKQFLETCKELTYLDDGRMVRLVNSYKEDADGVVTSYVLSTTKNLICDDNSDKPIMDAKP